MPALSLTSINPNTLMGVRLRSCSACRRHPMAKKFPTNPSHPERICWGCDLYCPAKALACGNGADRTMHPVELFGEDWDSFDDRFEPPAVDNSKPTPL